jgi:hypothetical protein
MKPKYTGIFVWSWVLMTLAGVIAAYFLNIPSEKVIDRAFCQFLAIFAVWGVIAFDESRKETNA